VDHEVEAAEFLTYGLDERVQLFVPSYVTGENERLFELFGELSDILLEPFTLIGDGQPRPLS
jgi:hypothetical protein